MKEQCEKIAHRMRTSFSVIGAFIGAVSRDEDYEREHLDAALSSLKKLELAIEELEEMAV